MAERKAAKEMAEQFHRRSAAAIFLAVECLEDDQDPESHIGQYMWLGDAMNSNITYYSETMLITPDLAQLAQKIMGMVIDA